MKRSPPLLSHQIDGDFVLYDPSADAVHTLNATARFIWERKDLSAEEIAHALEAHYQVPFDAALKDVVAMLEKFNTLGLIRESDPI